MEAAQENPAYLVPVSGPALPAMQLDGGGVRTLGRQEHCDLRVPAGEERVSRIHARFVPIDGRWLIGDAGSRWGTFVNGVRLEAGREIRLNEGDRIGINPWTFAFSRTPRLEGATEAADDALTTGTLVRSLNPGERSSLAGEMLGLLLESAEAIHAAASESEVAERLMEDATRGAGMPNAALLKPVDSGRRFEVVASRRPKGALGEIDLSADGTGGSEQRVWFSRSLIAAASQGSVSELSGGGDSENTSESIVQMGINAALCVPIMLGGSVGMYLYLDSRSRGAYRLPVKLRPNAAQFCAALGRMASLALSNLHRIDIEKRQSQMEAEMAAAATAQRWILPRRDRTAGTLRVIGESRAGQYVGGDFFDVIELEDGRVALALGDVAGKGMSAGLLMAAAQGFLHAALRRHADAARAVAELNVFIHPRRPENKFLTLWVAVVDVAAASLSYVDAGHGYALLLQGGSMRLLNEGTGVPVGVVERFEYVAVDIPFDAGSAVVVVSDGVIEQFDAGASSSGQRGEDGQFGIEGVKTSLMGTAPGDEVERIFASLYSFARTQNLADDATVVVMKG